MGISLFDFGGINMGYIYKVTNNINNKVYIGQTRRTIEIRWKEHIRDSFKPSRSYTSILHSAIRKYGEEAFSIIQLEKCENNLLNNREKYWIEYYDSCNNGYNISHGGAGYLKCNDEEILALWDEGLSAGEIGKELNLCNDTVSRRLKSCDISQDEILKRGRIAANLKKKKPVYQYDLEGNFIQEYQTIELAEASIGGIKIKFPPDYVSPIGGFQWRREKQNKIESINAPKINNAKAKIVYQYSLDGQYLNCYRTASEAAKAIGKKNGQTIGAACLGKNKTSYGYRWSYEKLASLPALKFNKVSKQVVRINPITNEKTYYASIGAAAKDNNTQVPDIIHVCTGIRNLNKGYSWRYATEEEINNIELKYWAH